MSTSSKKSSLAKKREYNGRVFVFTSRKYKDQSTSAKNIIASMDMDPSDIKIDDKPYLYEIMQQLTNGRSDVPQIFFNSKYIGGLTELVKLKDQGLLKSMIDEAKYEADPGPLYRVYRAQAELFSVCPPELYFPPPLNRRITCIVRLVNRTSKYTVYKLKTTSPKVFAVLPKQGFIPPNQVEKLEVIMNGTDVPLKQEKFRVEGIMLNYGSEDMKNMVDDVFKKADPKVIVKQIINCKFETPPDNMKITQFNDGTIFIEELNFSTNVVEEFIPSIISGSASSSSTSPHGIQDLSPSHASDITFEDMTSSVMQNNPLFYSMHEYQNTFPIEQPEQTFSTHQVETISLAEQSEKVLHITNPVSYIDANAGYANLPPVATGYSNMPPVEETVPAVAEALPQLANQNLEEPQTTSIELHDREQEEEERKEKERQEHYIQKEKEQQAIEEEKEEGSGREEAREEEDLEKLEKLAKETRESIEKRVSKKESERLIHEIDALEYQKLKDDYKKTLDQLKSVMKEKQASEDSYRAELQKLKERVREVEDLLANERAQRKRSLSERGHTNSKSATGAAATTTKTEGTRYQLTEKQYDLLFVIIVAIVAFIFGWLM